MTPINTMTFRLRNEDDNCNLLLTAEDKTLQKIMQALFNNDDYVFRFAHPIDFENINPFFVPLKGKLAPHRNSPEGKAMLKRSKELDAQNAKKG